MIQSWLLGAPPDGEVGGDGAGHQREAGERIAGGGLGYWLWNNGDELLGVGALLNTLAIL